MRIAEQIEISAPPSAVWEMITDPSRYLHFMAGMTRWEIADGKEMGLGSRYRTLMRVGSAEVGGVVEIVEWNPGCDIAWTSVTGIDQRGRWRVRQRPHDRSRVELRLSYGVAGSGIGGLLAEIFAAPTVRGHLRRSLQQLKRQVEHEQLREAAAARRAARTSSSTSAAGHA
jgi:uncharacterized membrane protein